MFYSFVAVAVGGAIGSLFRWFLGLQLNSVFPNLPLGTLAANLSAGYAIGILIAVFNRYADLPVEWRLFAITGILGGLSTFSTFSGEVTTHFLAGRVFWAITEIAGHLIGSLVLTALGIWTVTVLTH
jgi:CrcB protein